MDLSKVYITYYPKLVRFATDLVAYEEDAENITQDVFVGLLEKKDTLKYIENMNAYIYKSVRNKCLDYLKNKVIQQKYVSNERSTYEQELKQVYQSDMLEIISEEGMEQIVIDAIDTLPPKCREIFLLSRYEGLKYREISERLGLSINTVDVQMGIALKKLRKKLGYYLCA